MNLSRRELGRRIAVGAAGAVIGVPIVLVAATWQPLDPVPRGSTDGEPGELERPRRRDRQNEIERATPGPQE